MVTINTLRMLVDASFFYAFAGFVAAHCGGSGAFAGAMLQCLCYGVASAAGKKRLLRMALLLPMGLCWYVYGDSLADCILLIPVAGYILWLTWNGDYTPDRDRQHRLFTLFLKVIAVFAPIAMLTGSMEEVTGVTFPFALMALAGSVLLLRALRHEPRTYCEKKYQLMNIATVGLAIAAAYLVSMEAVLNGAAAVIGAAYRYLILPVLMLLISVLITVLRLVGSILPLKDEGYGEAREPLKINLVDMAQMFSEEEQAAGPGELLRRIVTAVLILAACTLLFLFFRWLSRREHSGVPNARMEEDRAPTAVRQERARARELPPVRSIRAQYRRFLKLCARLGVPPEKSSTSLDVDYRARDISALRGVCGEIREIYIRARYAGRAGKENVQDMRRLCAAAKKDSEHKA